MAMSKENILQFQDVIRCDLCVKAAAKLHCDTCQVYICHACVGTHIISDTSKQHLVVECKKRSKIKLTECKSHAPQRCDLKCKKCNVPVCSKCMTSTHANHTVIDIIDFCKTKQEEIRQENKEIESIKISKLETANSKIKEQIASLPKRYAKTKENIAEHGKEWHKDVDVIINTFADDVDKMMGIDLNTLRRHQQALEEIICLADQILQENASILKSSDASAFDIYKQRLGEVKNVPLNFVVNAPQFTPLQIDKKHLENCFGKLKSSSVDVERKETDHSFVDEKKYNTGKDTSLLGHIQLCNGKMFYNNAVPRQTGGQCTFCSTFSWEGVLSHFKCTDCGKTCLSCKGCFSGNKGRPCREIL